VNLRSHYIILSILGFVFTLLYILGLFFLFFLIKIVKFTNPSHSISIYKINYFIIKMFLFSHSLALCEQGNNVSLSPSPPSFSFLRRARKLCAPSISKGTKYKLFFWHIPHFIYADQRRYLTISLCKTALPSHSHAS